MINLTRYLLLVNLEVSLIIFQRFATKRVRLITMDIPDSKKIFVWKDEGAKNLEILLGFSDVNGVVKKVFMKRPIRGPFNATKTRLEIKLQEILEPKAKLKIKRKKDAETNLAISTQRESQISKEAQIQVEELHCDENTTNEEIFYGCKSLHIGSNSYPLVCDVPVIEKLSVALSPIVGCPVMPSCDWKSDRPASKVVFDWFVADKLYDLDIIRDASNAPCFSADGWRHVHTGPIFWPSAELSGLYLAVLAHFGDKALAKSTVCPTVIQIPEEPFIFERRQLNYCASPLEDPERIRVVCYNILADLYLNLRLDQDRLFFPYCPKKFQEAGYRYPVILRELKGYSADLICLQEVDFRMQKRFLISFLRDECGLASEFRCSAGPVNEGQLIAYRPSKFRLVESIPSLGRREAETEADRDNGESQSLGSAKNNDKSQEKTNPFQGVRISDLVDFPENEDISRLLDANQEMSQYLRKKATALQIVHLECVCDPSIRLLVLNTHLTFDPAYEHIKLLQAALALRYLTRIQRDVRATLPSKSRVIAIACGDLNSTPTSGVARLFRDGRVDASPENWGLNVGGTGIELNVGAKFTNLAGFPEYTNYTKYSLPNPQNFSVTGLTPTEQNQTGFAGCLDYIWSFPPVRVESVAPMPAHELVIRYTALPSSIAPSDHLPLVCDISLLS